MESRFKTNDISLAAFLLTQKVNYLKLLEEDNSRFSFVFLNRDKCELLRKEYLNNAPAPAQLLFSKRELLISEIKQKT